MAAVIDEAFTWGDDRALTNFILALGATYDKDPRLAFVPMGLLGLWGEWHNFPSNELFASKAVQTEVMEAYNAAFKHTRVLARYPADSNDATYAANDLRNLGYHDDRFAWATMDRFSKVKSRAMTPRHPSVPKCICIESILL